MNHQIFVPVTDDLIYNHPQDIEGPLVPYSAGMECQNWLSIELNPDESVPASKLASGAKREAKSSHLRLV